MLKPVFLTVPAGVAGSPNTESPGTLFRAKEADYPFFVSFDDGDWIPWDVGMEVAAIEGAPLRFQRFKIKHFGPTDAEFTFLIGDKVRVTDNRLTISESRNGSASSFIPPNLAEYVSTVGAGGVVVGAWYELVPYEAGRQEVWLNTDAAAAAYWGLSNADTLSSARNLVTTGGVTGWVKIPTKAAIFIRHTEAAKTITALSFSF